jgi:hypothetical protein
MMEVLSGLESPSIVWCQNAFAKLGGARPCGLRFRPFGTTQNRTAGAVYYRKRRGYSINNMWRHHQRRE